MALLMEIMPRFMIYDTKTTSAILTPYLFNIGKLNEPKQANKNYPKYPRIKQFHEMYFINWVLHIKYIIKQDGPSLESSSFLNVTLRYLGPWDIWTLDNYGPF